MIVMRRLVFMVPLLLAFTPSAAQAATCSEYSNQADAQRAADTRDADSDGIYCEALPCPCSNGGGGSSPPAPTPVRPAKPKPVRIVSPVGRYRSPTSQIACLLDDSAKRLRCSTRSMASRDEYFSLRARGTAKRRALRRIRGGKVVPYGQRLYGRGFSCLSTEQGFRCSNRDGHGMFLSLRNLFRF